jgi:hypothetical protein
MEIVSRGNGDLIVRGAFAAAGGVPAPGLARWDGTAWSSFGPVAGTISRMLVMPNDDLIIATYVEVPPSNYIAVTLLRWNGTSWSALPGSGDAPVTSMLTLPSGQLVVGGAFSWFGTFGNWTTAAARWDGTTWSAYANGLGSAIDLALSSTGNLLAGGTFFPQGWGNPPAIAATWNGASWQPVGPTAQRSASQAAIIAGLPGGDVLVGGSIPELGGLPMRNLVRIDSNACWTVGGTPAPWFSIPADPAATGGVLTKALLPNGDILLSGVFSEMAGVPTPGLIRVTPGCAPSSASLPTGCVGPFGPMRASATGVPAVGGVLATDCSGMGPNSLAVAVFGVGHWSPLLSLAAATPLGLPGCQLIPTLEYMPWIVPVGGVATHSLAIANSSSLVGMLLWHQFVQVEFTVGGAPGSLSVSNGLQLRLQ